MNNDEAKFILRAYRPSGRDAGDATFSAALAQARHDPMLSAWFEREQKHDMTVAAKLRELAPPPGLREAILAGGRVSRPTAAPRHRHWPTWLALAAGLAVVLTLAGVWQGRRAEAAQVRYAEFAVQDTARGGHHDADNPVVHGLLASLADGAIRLPGSLPLDVEKLKANGCRTVKFDGREVMEVCFARDGVWYHLYVLPRSALPSPLPGTEPTLLAMNGSAVAVWSDGRHDFAVVSPDGMAALKRLAS